MLPVSCCHPGSRSKSQPKFAALRAMAAISRRCVWVALLIWAPQEAPAENQSRLHLSSTIPPRSFLQRSSTLYQNFAYRNFANYPDHAYPYEDFRRAFYGSMGDSLLTGYDLYHWIEQRRPGLEYGSVVTADLNIFQPVFDHLVVSRDGYKDWGYSIVVGDGLIARFTPLTLSRVDINGLRFDAAGPGILFTGLASRLERPPDYYRDIPAWVDEGRHTADFSTLLLGGRVEGQLGALRLGLNGVNLHSFQSSQPGNSLKGVIRPERPLVDWIVLRFADDSPGDGGGGPVVHEVGLIINGQTRPDIRPQVIRHRAKVPIQVGSVSRATGEFRPQVYNRFSGPERTANLYYRGREVPFYADYLYRFDHEAGHDVSDATNLDGLLANFQAENSGAVLRADGDWELVYMFDLRAESAVQSVEVDALVGNDYRIDVATLWLGNPNGRNYAQQYRSSFYETMARARGNVQDLSNLKRVRFHLGENTALFTYGVDGSLDLAGVELKAEYIHSALYGRYPGHANHVPAFDSGPRFDRRGRAYFINATHWFGRGRLGAEHFAVNPGFTTEMRAYVQGEYSLNGGVLDALANDTVYWHLVQDNEDGDRYPDVRIGKILGTPKDDQFVDPDGVFPGRDADRDGLPDTNRNLNGVPDYHEPFLQYYVESNEFEYGLDRNNNDEPDHLEDDPDADYPYDADQRGTHLFGQVDLNRYLSVTLGRYDVRQVAGAGRNRSTYALVTYRRQGVWRLRRLYLENQMRRVQDDIPDEFALLNEIPNQGHSFSTGSGFTPGYATVFANHFVDDPLNYRDSHVNESYLEARLNPCSTLNLVQKLRLRLNWQRGGGTPEGGTKTRRLDYSSVVSRVDYTIRLMGVTLQPQFKFTMLRLVDRKADRRPGGSYAGRALRSQLTWMPILRMEYPLMSRTTLQGGIQGLGPAPFRFEDRVRRHESLERRTLFFNAINRSSYFGYDLFTIFGVSKDSRQYDDRFHRSREFDTLSFFARAVIGFSEYGRPL